MNIDYKKSLLWAYTVTRNVSYLHRLRKLDMHYVDSMKYVWDINFDWRN